MPKQLTANEITSAPRGERYLTLSELRAKLGNRSRSAIYGDLAAGRLPQPLRLGARIYWPEGALDAFLFDRAARVDSANLVAANNEK